MWLKMGINLKAKTKRRHFDPGLQRGFFCDVMGILCQMLPVNEICHIKPPSVVLVYDQPDFS